MDKVNTAYRIRNKCRYEVDAVLQQNQHPLLRLDIINWCMVELEFTDDPSYLIGDILWYTWAEECEKHSKNTKSRSLPNP